MFMHPSSFEEKSRERIDFHCIVDGVWYKIGYVTDWFRKKWNEKVNSKNIVTYRSIEMGIIMIIFQKKMYTIKMESFYLKALLYTQMQIQNFLE